MTATHLRAETGRDREDDSESRASRDLSVRKKRRQGDIDFDLLQINDEDYEYAEEGAAGNGSDERIEEFVRINQEKVES